MATFAAHGDAAALPRYVRGETDIFSYLTALFSRRIVTPPPPPPPPRPSPTLPHVTLTFPPRRVDAHRSRSFARLCRKATSAAPGSPTPPKT
jgi:hypothetical protein